MFLHTCVLTKEANSLKNTRIFRGCKIPNQKGALQAP
jgi:hypothetical protein